MIERFSEDIDIALDPMAFGREYKTNPSHTYVKTLKKEGCAFTSTVLLDALKAQFNHLEIPGVATHLTKSSLVECSGRVGANAWTNKEGEVKASLTFHVNSIKLHGGNKGIINAQVPVTTAPVAMINAGDDLPF